MRKHALLLALLLAIPSASFGDDITGSSQCAPLAQAAAAGLAARIQADDQTINPPKSVTTLSCLSNFFNGVGLNVITNTLDPSSLLQSVEGQICSAVQSTWRSLLGSTQCGLTVTGFNIGFGGLGGGTFCPKLSFGGSGPPLGSIGTSVGPSLPGQGNPPTGYTLPPGTNF